MHRKYSLAIALSLVAVCTAVAAAAQEQLASVPVSTLALDVPDSQPADLRPPLSEELPRDTTAGPDLYRDECPTLQESELPGDPHEDFAKKHRLVGTASYYSTFFEGRRTASGQIYHNRGFTAAHRTLPFGTVVEVTSRATGKKVRVLVNDRGPFSGGFILDLTPAAARKIGVDRAEDRTVDIRIVALPGEDVPDEGDDESATVAATARR